MFVTILQSLAAGVLQTALLFRHWTSELPSEHVELIKLAAQASSIVCTTILKISSFVFCEMTRDGSGIIAVQIALHERSPVRQKQFSVTVYLRDHDTSSCK